MEDIKPNKIIRTKRKTIALVVNEKAQLIIRSPLNTTTDYIEKLVYQKRHWIREKQELIRLRRATYRPKEYVNGEEFLVLGIRYPLRITSDKNEEITIEGKQLLFPNSYISEGYKYMLLWYKRKAKEVIEERVKLYSELLGIKYKSVKISNTRKQWGSCGSKGTLNFSWRLYMAPIIVIDYVVVHELIHILIPNHSKDYWAQVQSVMPDYHEHKKWLKDNQGLMKL